MHNKRQSHPMYGFVFIAIYSKYEDILLRNIHSYLSLKIYFMVVLSVVITMTLYIKPHERLYFDPSHVFQ